MILRETRPDLTEYGWVPISFEVESVLDVTGSPGSGDLELVERACPPWTKDYDAEDDGGPGQWATRFDTSGWIVLSAWREGTRVGGVVGVHGDPGIDMLEGRPHLAVMWDLRVHPEARGTGVGSALLARLEEELKEVGCSELKVETQNVNVAACRFYERSGFELRTVEPGAYPEHPEEIMLLWYKAL